MYKKLIEKKKGQIENIVNKNIKINTGGIKSQKGITLVALVVTIVILIILATVSINVVLGEGGLIQQAKLAKELASNSMIAEEESMNTLMQEYANIMAAEPDIPEPPQEPEKSEVEEAIENVTKYAETTPIKDDLENTVYIPGGFHLAEDSSTKVEGGIVIEDDAGNQFVWIPTGEYKVTEEVDSDGTRDGKMTNTLSRRTFTSIGATIVSGDTGIAFVSYYFYGEGNSSSIASGTIGAFKTSATTKGGFYIGRYEQGTGNLCKAGVEPYVNVTRDKANNEAKAMYNGNSYVTSELISSYAWDTALNFICQTNEAGYTLATTTSDTYGNIGTSNPTKTGEYGADKYSKICDFLGNRWEWTTEYYSISGYPCVKRGGDYNNSNYYAAFRNNGSIGYSNDGFGFRVQLYVK